MVHYNIETYKVYKNNMKGETQNAFMKAADVKVFTKTCAMQCEVSKSIYDVYQKNII